MGCGKKAGTEFAENPSRINCCCFSKWISGRVEHKWRTSPWCLSVPRWRCWAHQAGLRDFLLPNWSRLYYQWKVSPLKKYINQTQGLTRLYLLANATLWATFPFKLTPEQWEKSGGTFSAGEKKMMVFVVRLETSWLHRTGSTQATRPEQTTGCLFWPQQRIPDDAVGPEHQNWFNRYIDSCVVFLLGIPHF